MMPRIHAFADSDECTRRPTENDEIGNDDVDSVFDLFGRRESLILTDIDDRRRDRARHEIDLRV